MGTVSRFSYRPVLAAMMSLMLFACADADVPEARNVDIPAPVSAEKRKAATNERPDSVLYLPLGEDILLPETLGGDQFPNEQVGPFELRGETLGGALQLILAEYDISIAFESEEGLSRTITVANLKGELGDVVQRVCSLANLYCAYERGTITVKDTQTFSVTMPPIGQGETPTAFMNDIATGLGAILGNNGGTPIVDPSTRTIVYTATARSAELASRYFQRLRANTAMIVFETYIWEVSLNAGNSTGIDWDLIDSFDKFNASISLAGSVANDFTNPVSIGLPTTRAIGATPTDLIEFLSQFGAVKTISQPQITVLSGSSAELRVADTQNYVSQISTTLTDSQSTTSATTDSVDSGFTLSIDSSWDKSTVYANINIDLTNVLSIDDFTFSDGGAGGTSTSIQLPQTSQRELTTQVRVRPGDSILIAGLVQENDKFNSRGPGLMEPVLPDSRTAETENLELVFLLRPRVVVYSTPEVAHAHAHKTKVHNMVSQAPMLSAPVPAPAPMVEPVSAPMPMVETQAVLPPVAPAPMPAPQPQPVYAPQETAVPSPLPVSRAGDNNMRSSYVPLSSDVRTSVAPASVQDIQIPEPAPVVQEQVTVPSSAERTYRSERPKISSRAYAGSNAPVTSYASRLSRAPLPSLGTSETPATSDAVEIYDISGDGSSGLGSGLSGSSSSSGYSTYGASGRNTPSLYDTTEYQN
ncbi:MAG: type II and III secretion system family protein [Alphaproteobacteria bacterium]|nr:type II and III secretion system family protein [Alphaproteobacteria bacterium]